MDPIKPSQASVYTIMETGRRIESEVDAGRFVIGLVAFAIGSEVGLGETIVQAIDGAPGHYTVTVSNPYVCDNLGRYFIVSDRDQQIMVTAFHAADQEAFGRNILAIEGRTVSPI